MAAYGALISLTNTINQILDHPRPPISLDKIKIKPLMEKVAFLQDFLENYTIDDDADSLEGRIIDAAHEAEDIIESLTESQIAHHIKVCGNGRLYRYLQKMIQIMTLCIESHIADPIETRGEANITWNDDDDSCLYRELHKVMYDFDSITKDAAAAIKDKGRKKIADATTTDDDVMNDDVILDKLTNNPYSEGAGGSNDVMIDVMGKLTDKQSSRWIIGIAGMGGIGKTTLAKNIYEHPLIVEHFDMRGWTTISQEYNSKRILLDVLDPLKNKGSEESEYEELGKELYQSLLGRRYLIVMDDIWGTDAWDETKRFFPNNSNNGSKVLITTRASKLALKLDGPDFFQMPFLKLDESWNLLRRCVFGDEQGCPPPELEEIGKNIATNCRGLPLSIVIIGGLLAKSEQTREKWQHILENLSSLVNLEEGERCFRILKLSYDQLPVHLKPCFLYMGMFPEDDKIHVTTLLKLWVDEGFVKPVAGNSLETIARAVYLNDLVLRNLIVVREWGCSQRIKRCSIHDLLRDLCIKEAERYKFFRTMEPTHNYYPDHHDQSWRAQRRISIIQHHAASERKHIHPRPLPKAVQSASRARTLICNTKGILPSLVRFKLLRVLNGYRVGELFHMANLRHLVISIGDRLPGLEFPPELYLLWNLRSLRLYLEGDYAPVLDI